MNEIGIPLQDLDTPALWVDLDRMERNIATVAGHLKAAGVNWRPHTKGIKVPAIAHQMVRAGAIGVTCAKVGEAEVMAAAGIDDILIANQIVSPAKITRLVNLRRQADVKVLVDDADNVAALGKAASAKGVTLGVLVEVNTGMDRCGVQPGAPTLALAQRVHATPGLRLQGLMTWEGHNLSHTDEELKRAGIEESVGQALSTAALCRSHGLPIDIISAGGSGTYKITAHIPGVTEIEAGGAIFCDPTYQSWGVDLEPALFVHATVTSRPAPERIILDTGFKTYSRGFNAPQPLGIEGVQSVVLSAEHGIVTLDRPNASLRVGDTIDLVVGYSDATVFMHDTLYGIRDGRVETAWAVQGRGKLR